MLVQTSESIFGVEKEEKWQGTKYIVSGSATLLQYEFQ